MNRRQDPNATRLLLRGCLLASDVVAGYYGTIAVPDGLEQDLHDYASYDVTWFLFYDSTRNYNTSSVLWGSRRGTKTGRFVRHSLEISIKVLKKY
ncbi:hypothetical protein BGW80DRAFT_1291506, partial [Lactifluus volemus]